ncbi:hypothetical protein [Paenibacillus sp. GCM10028914]
MISRDMLVTRMHEQYTDIAADLPEMRVSYYNKEPPFPREMRRWRLLCQ